jgi:ABC-2 type transport system permease protein
MSEARYFCLATATLWQREIVRFFRQRSRVVGALGPPILFWFLIGSGLGESFKTQRALVTTDVNYLQYFFPGTITLIVLFTAIFSTISVIEDRHEGFLQSVLVAPLSRLTLVLGKILGGTTLAFGQAVIFLLLAPVAGIHVPLASVPLLLLNLLIISFGLTGLGFLLAWKLDSTQGFHAIMNLLLIPMWLLSGALFPPEGASAWIRGAMFLNPLSYGLSALQRNLLVNGHPLAAGMGSVEVGFLVSLGFALLMFGASVWAVENR